MNIDLFTGRSLEAKKARYRALVKNLEPFGIPPNHVSEKRTFAGKRLDVAKSSHMAQHYKAASRRN